MYTRSALLHVALPFFLLTPHFDGTERNAANSGATFQAEGRGFESRRPLRETPQTKSARIGGFARRTFEVFVPVEQS